MIHNNVEEAFTLANMAKHLNLHFDAINNFIVAYRVHVAASHKKPDGKGGMDCYAVLGLASSIFADAKTAKKHYKMLALMVYPDKNSSVQAQSAFKLMSQAWKVISSQASTEKTNDNLWNNSSQKASKSSPLRRLSSWGTTRASSS
ncbi:hypothetical protein LOK49_LG09G00347 [Camellia lanceoleosa]|uniref:Uncharacterized protein n=1 Tax=Camellia lanceoleosa TaxID=1840588 RepID=A0ACC0GP68_9ERIC|nr:hypothetical protein LOK49_LG09G00347 [Camellia lanceoleosa]